MDKTAKHDKQFSQQADVDGKKKKKRKNRDHDFKNTVQEAPEVATDKDMKIDDTTDQPKDIKLAESKEELPEKKKKKNNKKKHDESTSQAAPTQENIPPSASLQAQTVVRVSSPDLKAKKSPSSPSKPDPTTLSQENTSENHTNPTNSNEEVKTKKKGKKDKKVKTVTHPSQTTSSSVAPATTSNPISSSVTTKEVEQFISSNKLTYEPPETSSNFPPVLKFDDVKVHDSLRKAFATFQKPSPIQSAVWPVLMAGKDVVGIAETGSGKTLAFGVPALQHILNTNGDKKSKSSSTINVLVVAPTRELAMQTETTLCEVGKLTSPPIKTLCVYGGVDKSSQRKALASSNVRIVVGTPGRLLDLANEGNLKLDHVSWLVLDEADRMLDKGFENDIRAIINLCRPSGSGDSKSRLTTMFSATWPTNVRRLAADFMHNPVRILVGADELMASCSVEQTVEVLEESRGKEWKLLNTLQGLSKSNNNASSQKDKIIVFALYKKEAQRLYEFLLRKNFQACCIEGNMSQDKRSKALEDFMTGKATILVATDVAARGLDIPKVEFVINVTFPLTIEDYIHRIGRTGRAGRKGKSITFFTDEDKAHAGELMRVLKDAGQVVPEALKQWGGQIKKKTHAAYGDHWKDVDLTVKAKKITFD